MRAACFGFKRQLWQLATPAVWRADGDHQLTRRLSLGAGEYELRGMTAAGKPE